MSEEVSSFSFKILQHKDHIPGNLHAFTRPDLELRSEVDVRLTIGFVNNLSVSFAPGEKEFCSLLEDVMRFRMGLKRQVCTTSCSF